MIEERRHHIRFPVIENVGEPVVLQFTQDHKNVSLPGYIINLSAGGMGIITLGEQASQLTLGALFVLDLKLPHLNSHNVEGKIYRIQKGRKAKLHHSNDEWFLALTFTKIKPSLVHHLNEMAEDWNICETKIQLNLPDICFPKCSFWDLCEKNVKLQDKKEKIKDGK